VSSSGYGVEVYDYDLRELYAFETADAAAGFVQRVREAVAECPHDRYETGLDFTVLKPLTGYDDVAFVESNPSSRSPYDAVAVVHVMRVGSGVLIQSYGSANNRRAAHAAVDRVAVLSQALAQRMCVFTVAGCISR
jgi:hypothetical protein